MGSALSIFQQASKVRDPGTNYEAVVLHQKGKRQGYFISESRKIFFLKMVMFTFPNSRTTPALISVSCKQ
jgi:hypothetical protein